MKLKQLLRAIISIFVGNSISITTDYFLSFLGPISWFFFYPKFIGVIIGSFFAGIIFKKRGWLIGMIISFVHIIYIILIIFHHPAYLTERTAIIDWLSLLPTGIFIIITGFIGGYFGEKIAKKKSNFYEANGKISSKTT